MYWFQNSVQDSVSATSIPYNSRKVLLELHLSEEHSWKIAKKVFLHHRKIEPII